MNLANWQKEAQNRYGKSFRHIGIVYLQPCPAYTLQSQIFVGEVAASALRSCNLWWECPTISPFWSDINDQIKAVLDVDIRLSPIVHFLLHIPTLPLGHYKQSALQHLLNVAKRPIPIYWKRAQVPNREEWIRKVNEIMEGVEWVATCKDGRERFS